MSTISILTEETEKLANRISEDLKNFVIGYAGNLKDIECGTRIRIPTDAGYVNCSISSTDSSTTLKVSCWMNEEMTETQENLENYNRNDET